MTLTPRQLNERRLSMQVANPVAAMVVLLGTFAFFLILTPVLTGLLSRVFSNPLAALRISMVLQDLLVFILPPIVTAVVCTRLPARMLAVDKAPDALGVLLSALALLCSVPAMNAIVAWNESWSFPAALGGLEQSFRQMEEAARNVTGMLMSGASVASLCVSVLIIGVMAGFGEELFFRGAMQRILMMGRAMNPHVAIWVTAVVFSLLHFQVFGFVPRMLLGAFFGYLLWWSGSLWLPILIHALNNTLVVVTEWMKSNHPGVLSSADTVGAAPMASASDMVLVIISVAATAAVIFLVRRRCLCAGNQGC
ncbi:MAG: CPBP family intramembrane metalloprotease [Muribaculaceae bacterium]|nr:CPBP family intramembrane metalloprotease [Muribaculaceae bacterium]